uniref:DUF4872 domain-containing protein n=1 Tax=candidate division WOR-3 bacterium TaxID=2052148 RepID=A0A7C4GBD6_UNCW3
MKRKWAGANAVRVKLGLPATWASLVGAAGSVLRSRGVNCDLTDVAGMSGYAFVVNIHPELCPSGPTGFDWNLLVEGLSALGLEVELAQATHDGDSDDAELVAELFERVRSEIDAGRACVVWGATDCPEFAVVYGYEDESYRVRSCRGLQAGMKPDRLLGPDEEPEPPVRFDELKAPGCVAAFLFGEPVRVDPEKADRNALARAAQLLGDRHAGLLPGFAHGAKAFSAWAEALEAGRAQKFGNAYNAAVWQEMQMFASGFCRRLAKRRERAAGPLDTAARLLAQSFAHLEAVVRAFPLPEGGEMDGRAEAGDSARRLRECAGLNERVVAALEQALALV